MHFDDHLLFSYSDLLLGREEPQAPGVGQDCVVGVSRKRAEQPQRFEQGEGYQHAPREPRIDDQLQLEAAEPSLHHGSGWAMPDAILPAQVQSLSRAPGAPRPPRTLAPA